MTTTEDRPAVAAEHVDLDIVGMTCASCSARIERKLNALDGVNAVVNLATERATVTYAAPVTVAELLKTVERTGYGASVVLPTRDALEDTGTTTEALRRRGMLACLLALGVLGVVMFPERFQYPGWWQLALTTPVVLWAALPFHRSALRAARHGTSTMDTLVSLGVSTAYVWSVVAVATRRDIAGTMPLYFDTAAVVSAFLLSGRWMEARAKRRSRSALESLLRLGAAEATLQRIDPKTGQVIEIRVPAQALVVGDRFTVEPGESVATDGVVVEGRSAIDASMVTGEPMPVDVTVGSTVTGGTINTTGHLVVAATAVGADTVLAGVTRLVEQAQTGKAPVQRLADRVSSVFVPVAILLALGSAAVWWWQTRDVAQALHIAVAVLVVACPCALGLATPTALLVGSGRGAQLGILIKGPEVLEDTRRVDTIVFDKTGTLTTGRPALVKVTAAAHLDPNAALRAAAAVESRSEHPIARAITAAARERGLAFPVVTDFESTPGAGATARIKDTLVSVGKAELFASVPDELRTAPEGTTVFVGWDGGARAAFTVADTVRQTSPDAVARLADLGLTAYLVTGDSMAAAGPVAAAVGIPESRVTAGVAPADKHAVVERLQGEGRVVAMAGDGVNDAAALAQADLGLAMGSGTDVAMRSADIVLVRSDVSAVVDAVRLSRATLRVIKQNLVWAFGYNVAAIPLAMTGRLDPMVAGAAMALSSVLVVSNSLRLRAFRSVTAAGRSPR